MNLTELQAKVNSYTTVVSSWVRNAGKMYFSGTPANVTVDMIDDNGNLTTTTLPNVAKFRKTVWDDVGAALGQLERRIYINPETGSDTGAGTETSPFATIAKAMSTTVSGGTYVLYLSDHTHIVDSRITTSNTFIYLYGVYGGGTSILFQSHENLYNYVSGITLKNSFLMVQYVGIVCQAEKNSSKSRDHSWAGAIFSGINSSVGIDNYGAGTANISLPVDSFPLVRSASRDNKGNLNLSLSHTRIAASMPLLEIQYGAGTASYLEYSTQERKNYAGESVSSASLITGVLLDANGSAKNILTNIQL